MDAALSFEDALARLEETIDKLQDGNIPLDQALHFYQEGMELAQHCDKLLQQAELTVQQLGVDTTGSLTVSPLDLP